MTYVETMALRARNECHSTNRCEGTIEQVIADTKRAHRIAILDEVDAPYTEMLAYLAVIEQAEVKAEGE